jgi:hypothetical protein
LVKTGIEVLPGINTDLGMIVVRDDDNVTVLDGTVEGQIVDENFEIVPNATVMISKKFTGDGIKIDNHWPIKVTTTDANGNFEIDGFPTIDTVNGHELESGFYLISEYGSFRSQPILIEERHTGTLFVDPIGSLEGTITCDLAPVPSIININSIPDKSLSLSVRTHSDGFYRFDRLAPGDYRISIVPMVSVCGMATGVEIASNEITVLSESTQNVSMDIYNANPPIANAGEDQVVEDTTPVTLDGTGSSDPFDTIYYEWYKFVPETGDLAFVDDEDIIVVPAPTSIDVYVLVVTDSYGAQDYDFTIIEHVSP